MSKIACADCGKMVEIDATEFECDTLCDDCAKKTSPLISKHEPRTKRIAYISDIHADHYPDPWNAINDVCESVEFFDCDWLFIAGDLAGLDEVGEYLTYMAGRLGEMGVKIFFVCGNHELYGHHIHDIHSFNKKVTPDNLVIMNRDFYLEDDILVVGAPGWIDGSWGNIYNTRTRYYKERYNDFRMIKGYGKLGMEYGKADYRAIDRSLSNPASKKIVMTHFLPTMNCLELKHLGDKLNHCYANNWEDLIYKHKINAWIYGHSHSKITNSLESTKFLTNGVGYPGALGCDLNVHILEI